MAPGSAAVLLWEGAAPSLDVIGALEPFAGPVDDPRDLVDPETVRFTVQMVGPAAVDEVSLDCGGAR